MHETVTPVADCDLLVIGAGAAGLFAAIHAGRTARERGVSLSIIAVDTAMKLGAKILVAGGGRCNVTHERVEAADYAGSTPPAIRKVLKRYGVDEVRRFFADAGVSLKREETGKLFTVSDSARSVLDALITEARAADVRLVHPARCLSIATASSAARSIHQQMAPETLGYCVETSAGSFVARRVILATGGRSLPKSGSDGSGHTLALSLGHTLTEPVVPALVPLVLPDDHFIRSLSGLTLPTRLTLSSASGRRLHATEGSTLCTHQGLSGPAVLDISRHFLVARDADPAVQLSIAWLTTCTAEQLDQQLQGCRGRGAVAFLRERVPERLAAMLCREAECPASGDVPREARRRLVQACCGMPLPIVGDRGFRVAEATAGGVPLSEVRLETMESRLSPRLYLAGELLDVDGRIGGFNFQWAWSSGFVAGTSAVAAAVEERSQACGSPPP
jgi:predicted Rossmann fold flavoprotein